MKYDLSNLVFLTFASNTCYVKVTDKKPDDVTIDLEKGAWTTSAVEGGTQDTFKIGGYRTYFEDRYGTIGVFDRTNVEHLDGLAHASTEAIRERGSVLED